MRWFLDFLSSSIGRKLLMSLTGLFLISFLVAHLVGNLQLIFADPEAFNHYAQFMGHNPIIQTIAKGLYFFIILHTIVGLRLWSKNKKAKGQKYVASTSANASWASKNMALLGTLILAFLFIHMGDFWWKLKFVDIPMATYDDGVSIKDAYLIVAETFSKIGFVIAYVIGMIILAFHLWHGFASAFQTLGINHKKYTPIIEFLGKAFSIIVPVAFAIIPIVMFLNK